VVLVGQILHNVNKELEKSMGHQFEQNGKLG